MKILFYLGHPAHYHLFKNIIQDLKNSNHKIDILIKKKDILEDLLITSNFHYLNILPEGRNDSKLGIIWGLIKRDFAILRRCVKYRPDLMIGTSTEITHIGKLVNIPSIIVNEDDYNAVPLFSKLGYPFATNILAPISCKTGKSNSKWESKTIHYKGFHELSYLHPKNFIADINLIGEQISLSKPFYIIRFAKLTAHHDKGKTGITTSLAEKIIEILSNKGNVYITAERKLESQFEKYRISIPANKIHHALAFADIYIGDSQTMAAEAAVLGTPSIRFNDFVGKLGYLEELETYGLTKGIKTSEPDKLFNTIEKDINNPKLKEEFMEKRKKMLLDKIDVASFFVWFIQNFPKSVKIMKENPDYQDKFK